MRRAKAGGHTNASRRAAPIYGAGRSVSLSIDAGMGGLRPSPKQRIGPSRQSIPFRAQDNFLPPAVRHGNSPAASPRGCLFCILPRPYSTVSRASTVKAARQDDPAGSFCMISAGYDTQGKGKERRPRLGALHPLVFTALIEHPHIPRADFGAPVGDNRLIPAPD